MTQVNDWNAIKSSLCQKHANLLFVPPVAFSRIVKRDYLQLRGERLQVPQRDFYIIPKKRLRDAAMPEDFDGSPERFPDGDVLLLKAPDEDEIHEHSKGYLFASTWRTLFQARIYAALTLLRRTQTLSKSIVEQRIEALGRSAFCEAHMVLEQEEMLFPESDPVRVYMEFVAFFLQMKHFTPQDLDVYFPGIADANRVEEVVSQEVDPFVLFEGTRPQGAPNPRSFLAREEAVQQAQQGEEPEEEESATDSAQLIQRAEKAIQKGNDIRAMLSYMRASRLARKEKALSYQGRALAVLTQFCEKLHQSFGPESPTPDRWKNALTPLLTKGRFGFVSSAGRLLYDLQRILLDRSRDLHKIDVVEWFLSLGKLPIKRNLNPSRELLVARYLRRALKALSNIRLLPQQHAALQELLRWSLADTEERIRDQFRPQLETIFREVDLQPQNLPERAAQQKLMEEMLDRLVDRGFFSMSEFRDAIARNNLKLPDVANPIAFFKDPLLRTDKRLHHKLAGSYRRGEFYLRLLQRLSALFFGTFVGRMISLWLLLPMLSAFVLLEGLQHILHLILTPLTGFHVKLLHKSSFGVISIILMGAFNVSMVRQAILAMGRGLWAMLRMLFVGLPRALWRLPWIVAFRKSKLYYFLREVFFKPGILALLVSLPLSLAKVSWKWNVPVTLGAFVVLSVLLNTYIGRNLQDFAADRFLRLWHRIRYRVLPGLVRLTLDIFKRILLGVDAVIYRVDEWLRFRSGENILSVAFKACFGVIWFFFTYFVRLYITLLVEPQVNPIKHFPVVTVSHKIILPFTKSLTLLLLVPLKPLFGTVIAGTIAGVTVVLLPGVFGFLVWEFKENWRLYKANQSTSLKPVLIGSHGETMVRFLRQGFHSGTIPKLFAKQRQAIMHKRLTRRSTAKQKHLQALHHVEDALRRFVQRELIDLLLLHPYWKRKLEVKHISIQANLVHIALHDPSRPQAPIALSFEEREGWLLASLHQDVWLATLTPIERNIFAIVLAGCYKLCGVQLVHQELLASLPAGARYDLRDEFLIVWPDDKYRHSALYDLSDDEKLTPYTKAKGLSLPTFVPQVLLFSQRAILWEEWVEFWDKAHASSTSTLPSRFARLLPQRITPS